MHFQEKYLLAENIFPLKAGNWLIRVFSGGWESSLDAGWREAWASGKRLLNIRDLLRQWLGGLAENVVRPPVPRENSVVQALPLPEAGAKMRPDNRLAGFSY